MRAKTLLDLGCACKTCIENNGNGCVDYPDSIIPAGTIIDRPDSYLLVQAGAAIPDDDECEKAAAMTPRAMELAQRAQLRAAAGIHPEDFEAFDSGEMIGYYPDGSPIPGPNAEETEEGLILP